MMSFLRNNRIQLIAIAGSLFILILLFELIRKRKLKEEYSLLWFFFGAIFMTFSIWRNGLELISRLLGITYAPATLFLVLIIGMFFILIHYSLIITKQTDYTKNLIQDIAILEAEVKKLKQDIIKYQK